MQKNVGTKKQVMVFSLLLLLASFLQSGSFVFLQEGNVKILDNKNKSIETGNREYYGFEDMNESIEKGLVYLNSTQNQTGGWVEGNYGTTTDIVGNCLRAFINFNNTDPRWQDAIEGALRFLRYTWHDPMDYPAGRDRDFYGGLIYNNRFSPNEKNTSIMRSHGIATTAMIEYYLKTGDPSLLPYINESIKLIVRAQNSPNKPSTLGGPRSEGGWGHTPNSTASNTSLCGWNLYPLILAESNGVFDVPDNAFEYAEKWLDMTSYNKSGFGETSSNDIGSDLTAIGVSGMMLLGRGDHPSLREDIEFLLNRTPQWGTEPTPIGPNENNPFDWYYYSTFAMSLLGGKLWRDWSGMISTMLIEHQNNNGSWTSTQDEIGRDYNYATAMAILCLELITNHPLGSAPPDYEQPTSQNNSPYVGATGDNFEFNISASDNMGINTVYVNWTHGDIVGGNESLTLTNGYWIGTITLDDVLDDLTYLVYINDNSENYYISNLQIVTVIDNDNPIANAGNGQTIDQGALVTFNGTGSIDNVGVVNYTWTFTDGRVQTLYGSGPTYTFRNAGVFLVTLNVTDSISNYHLDTMTVTVIDKTNPVANASLDQIVDQGALVTFNGSGSSDNVEIVNFTWTFTDGGIQILNGSSPNYTFYNAGIFVVTLNVTDTIGNYDTDTMTVTVNDITKPVADAGADRTIGQGAHVTFNGSGSSDNVGIINYTWSFADGGVQRLYGSVPSYTFNNAGEFVVVLNIADPAGNYHTDTMTVKVNDITNPLAKAETIKTVIQGDMVTFNGSGSSDNVGVVNYTWIFTDGGTQILYGVSPTYKFANVGEFMVSLNVTDAAGNYGEFIFDIKVTAKEEDEELEPTEDGLSAGIIAAIAFGVIIVLVITILFLIKVVLKKKTEGDVNEEEIEEKSKEDIEEEFIGEGETFEDEAEHEMKLDNEEDEDDWAEDEEFDEDDWNEDEEFDEDDWDEDEEEVEDNWDN